MAVEHSLGLTKSQKLSVAPVNCAGILAGMGRPEAVGRLIECLAEPVAWPGLLAQAHRLRVTPLVYAGLRSVGADAVPPAVLDSFRRATLGLGVLLRVER